MAGLPVVGAAPALMHACCAKLLSKKAGFMGLGERGVGGSKCGATSALALMFADPANPGQTQLLTGNIGDARIVLVRGGQVRGVQRQAGSGVS
ncbi:PPM-type phosphatase domain-containing protein [Haematococcus lacustris]|uniref:PPM-type phosphatase domain-containing protein n=1 Tax=Haematococcus lacustris TaxID=44745 RepID=A0A699YY54_HAELA|nr:PPM-type phosphatase domain-containing protein [Haematococcus lacustris]